MDVSRYYGFFHRVPLQGNGFFVFVIVIMIVSPTGDFYFLVSHFCISPSLVLFL